VRVHTSRPSEALGGRSAVVRCGQCLGGGGSINGAFVCFLKQRMVYISVQSWGGFPLGMTYTRACASDYDDWEKVYKNPGWGPNELIPLLRKVGAQYPTCTSLCSPTCDFTKTKAYQVSGAGQTHGTDGPLKVSFGTVLVDYAKQFLQVARALDPARARAPSDADTNDLSTINA